MLVPLMAWEIEADGAAVGAAVDDAAAAAAATVDGPSGAAMVPVQTEFSGQQATFPTWSRAHWAFWGQQTGEPKFE